MNKIQKKLWLVMIILFVLLVSQGVLVEASRIDFSVETVLPTNQRDQEVTYFDLLMKPNETQELIVKATNTSETDITVLSAIHPATTNSNGVIEYGESNTSLNKSAPYNIADLVEVKEPERLIKAKETVDIVLIVKMPAEEFTGVLAGGISLQQKEEGDTAQENQGVSIINKYNYSIALLLRQTDASIKAQLELTDIKADQANGQNQITAVIQNDQAQFVNQVTTKATIKKVGEDEVLYESTSEKMQLAPNSSLKYPILLDNQKFKAGKYLLTLKLATVADDWVFEREFRVTPEEAKRLNETALIETPNRYTTSFIVGTVVLIIGIGMISFMIGSRVNEKRNDAKRQLNMTKH